MKVPYQGRLVEAQEIEVLTSKEDWNTHELANGKILKVKTVLVSVLGAIGEKGQDGEPVYIIKSQSLVKVQ